MTASLLNASLFQAPGAAGTGQGGLAAAGAGQAAQAQGPLAGFEALLAALFGDQTAAAATGAATGQATGAQGVLAGVAVQTATGATGKTAAGAAKDGKTDKDAQAKDSHGKDASMATDATGADAAAQALAQLAGVGQTVPTAGGELKTGAEAATDGAEPVSGGKTAPQPAAAAFARADPNAAFLQAGGEVQPGAVKALNTAAATAQQAAIAQAQGVAGVPAEATAKPQPSAQPATPPDTNTATIAKAEPPPQTAAQTQTQTQTQASAPPASAPAATPQKAADTAAVASQPAPQADATHAQDPIATQAATQDTPQPAVPAPALTQAPAQPAQPARGAARERTGEKVAAADPSAKAHAPGQMKRIEGARTEAPAEVTAASGAAQTEDDAAGDAPADPDKGAPTQTSAETSAPAQAPTPQALHTAALARGAPQTVANLAAQIIKKLEAKTTRFDVELDPAGLGKVNVRVDIGADGQISAALACQNPHAAEVLKARSDELRQALEQAGFDLSGGGLSFEMAGGQGGGAGAGQGQNDSAPTFRGRAFATGIETAGEAVQAAANGALRLNRNASGVDIRI